MRLADSSAEQLADALGGVCYNVPDLRVNGEHESIYDAIVSQDPDAARAAMRTHLANSRERRRRAIA